MRTSRLTRYSILWIVLVMLIWRVQESQITPGEIPSVGEHLRIQGEIYKKETKKDSQILYLKNLRILDNNVNVAADSRLPVYLTGNQVSLLPQIGKTIQVTGSVKTLQESLNPGNFDQKSYYQRQQIYWMLQNAKIEDVFGDTDIVAESCWKFRQVLSIRVLEHMEERTGGILCAMLFGNTSYIVDEVKEYYQKTGIGHLYAVSSLHMNFWGLGVIEILKRTKCSKKVSVTGGILFLTSYIIFSGMSISAVRAFIMFILRMGTVFCGREYDGLSAAFLAAAIQLTVTPTLLFESGFLLSYGAVLGIYLAGPILKEKIGAKIGIPLAVQCSLFPIMLSLNYEICSVSFLWNLIAVPMASLIMISGAVSIIVTPFFKVTNIFLLFYEKMSAWILNIPGARIVVGSPTLYQVAGYYVCVAVFLWLLFKKPKSKGALWLFLGCLVLIAPQRIHRNMEITMLNVGQGDCFFLQLPTGESCLIDGGSSSVFEVGTYRIEPFLKYKGIGTLDYVFVSHGDEDHLNGISELLRREKVGVTIKNLVVPPRKVWEEKLKELVKIARQHQVSVYEIERGQQFVIGEMKFTCLWPGGEMIEPGNEASMVLSVTYGKFDMLFTGDLEKQSEALVCEYMKELQVLRVIPCDYEVLKIGHHGSKNGTSEKLLDICKVEAAFISAGEKNQYGHPHQEVVSRLANRGINRYNTLDGSAVNLYTDGEKYYILEP